MTNWYIEDAGGGCRAFSEVLVLVSENPVRIYRRDLPLTWPSSVTIEEMVFNKVLEMLNEAKVTREDYLYVCSSNLFYHLHKWLTDNGYRWETAKMDGLAHEMAERYFQEQIVQAGFPAQIQLEDRNYRVFYGFVDAWIKEDLSRSRFSKDMQVRCKPVQFKYILRANTGHVVKCSRCRGKIQPFTPLVQYRYREQGKKKTRYYHPDCTPVKPHKNKLEAVEILWQHHTFTGVMLAAKESKPCRICNREIPPGEKAVHAIWEQEFIFGHRDCLLAPQGENNKNIKLS